MRLPLRIVLGLSVLLLLAPPIVIARQDAPARSPRNASYTLRATLDPVNRLIQGTGRLTWRNITSQPATELRFHLYWNAWRDPTSTWLREQAFGRLPRLARRPTEDRGFIDVGTLRRVSVSGDQDLLPRARFIAPDDGNAEDRTVLAVPLDRPVAAGESIDVEMAWTSRVPRTYARTGAIGNYFFVAQWFPKIGVLEDTGWNAHQFHAATEFFADFGVYDVSLTVPSGWMVGSTGLVQSATDNGNGTTSHRYLAADVHDFAWTTSPDFLERRARFEKPSLPPVDIRLLLQPEHRDQADRHFNAARAALEHYGTWFGPYPHGHLTIIDPVTIFNPAQGEGTRGMEYPTLITAGTRWFAPWVGSEPEAVTLHETGHQFLYGIVATNEVEHAWMDEGLNTYATARALAEGLGRNFVTVERYFGGLGAWSYTDARWSREIDGNRLNAFRPVAAFDVQSTPTWRYWPGTASQTSYNKTALWLTTLERMIGWDTMQRVLATYYARGAFRHPAPTEFFATVNEVSGQDLTWFFDAVHRSSAAFDYAVAQVTWAPQISGENSGATAIDTTVVVRRVRDGVFPVDVRVTFGDGSSVTERWDGRDPWRAFKFRRGSAPRTVEVDPERVLMLDLNYTNNSWTAQPRAAEASGKWALRWLTWVQDLLLAYAFFS